MVILPLGIDTRLAWSAPIIVNGRSSSITSCAYTSGTRYPPSDGAVMLIAFISRWSVASSEYIFCATYRALSGSPPDCATLFMARTQPMPLANLGFSSLLMPLFAGIYMLAYLCSTVLSSCSMAFSSRFAASPGSAFAPLIAAVTAAFTSSAMIVVSSSFVNAIFVLPPSIVYFYKFSPVIRGVNSKLLQAGNKFTALSEQFAYAVSGCNAAFIAAYFC